MVRSPSDRGVGPLIASALGNRLFRALVIDEGFAGALAPVARPNGSGGFATPVLDCQRRGGGAPSQEPGERFFKARGVRVI